MSGRAFGKGCSYNSGLGNLKRAKSDPGGSNLQWPALSDPFCGLAEPPPESSTLPHNKGDNRNWQCDWVGDAATNHNIRRVWITRIGLTFSQMCSVPRSGFPLSFPCSPVPALVWACCDSAREDDLSLEVLPEHGWLLFIFAAQGLQWRVPALQICRVICRTVGQQRLTSSSCCYHKGSRMLEH